MDRKIYILNAYTPNENDFLSKVWETAGGEITPLGIYYLAAFLRENGVDVAVADTGAFRLTPDDIINEIAVFSPAFVGISSTTMSFANAVAMAGRIKEAFPHIVTIIGGSHVTSSMAQAMSCKDFDYGVIGEGELTALELINSICSGSVSGGKPVSEIRGVAFRDENGRLVYTGPRPFIDDLDALPFPALDLVPDTDTYTPPLFEHRAQPLASMITSRGCPGHCTFCSTSMGKRYRARSAENVFHEIKFLKQTYDIREIRFLDDNFLLDRQRIYDLFEMTRVQGIFFHWVCLARIDSVDYDFLKFLRDNGCWFIMFGIESGDPEILKTIKKNLSLERTAEVVGWCRELGIKTQGLFIIGHPNETIESIDRTIDYALGVPLDIMMCTINTPYPGTRQQAEIDQYGTLTTTDWSQYTGLNPVFVPHGLTRELLLEKHREMLTRFYLRPRIALGFVSFFLGRGGVRRMERIKALATLAFITIRTALKRG